jgi:hypothetical protein
MFLAVAAAEPNRGWGGPLAILAAFVAFRLLMPLMHRLRAKIGNPSPPPALPTAERVKVKATVGVTPDEPAEPEDGWWGRIVEIGGVRVRQARQVMATGSHVLPEADEPDEEPYGDIDLDLDNKEMADDEEDEERVDTAEEYIGRALGLGIPYNQMVKVLIDHYGVSRSTAKRRISEVRAARA